MVTASRLGEGQDFQREFTSFKALKELDAWLGPVTGLVQLGTMVSVVVGSIVLGTTFYDSIILASAWYNVLRKKGGT